MIYDAIKKGIRYITQLEENILSWGYEYKAEIENKIPYWKVREKEHPAILRYGVVILLVVAAVIAKIEINALTGYHLPFILFYSVILVSAWYGGFRPGVLAVGLCTIVSYHFYTPVPNEFSPYNLYAPHIIFILEGLLSVAVCTSMHDTLQILEESKKHSQYFASIAQHISDAVISTDMNFTIQSWNHGAELLYNCKRGEVMGKSLDEVLAPIYATPLKGTLKDVLLQEGHWKGEVTHQRKNGGRIHILTSMSILRADYNKIVGVVIVNRDITDRKKLEQGKDDFVALASHELKTPLTSIKLYSEILKHRFIKNDDKKSLEYLSKVDSQMSKLLELVNHLLDISKVQSGKLQYHMEDVAIDSFVSQVIKDIQELIPSHRIIIRERAHAFVNIDKDRLRQVLVNIINNAVKYSAKADKVIFSLHKNKHQVTISVQDFGIGIPKELHKKIFDRFYQATDSKGYTYSGMGLGLYIAHEIIDKHHGKLWVESEEGKGATFYFTLPIINKHG